MSFSKIAFKADRHRNKIITLLGSQDAYLCSQKKINRNYFCVYSSVQSYLTHRLAPVAFSKHKTLQRFTVQSYETLRETRNITAQNVEGVSLIAHAISEPY